MNVLEGMKNMGETETVLFHGKGGLTPPRKALLLLLFPHRARVFSAGSVQATGWLFKVLFSRKCYG